MTERRAKLPLKCIYEAEILAINARSYRNPARSPMRGNYTLVSVWHKPVHFSIFHWISTPNLYIVESFFFDKHKLQEIGKPLSTWTTCHVWLMTSYSTIRPVSARVTIGLSGTRLSWQIFKQIDEDGNSRNTRETTVKLIEKLDGMYLR